MASWEISKVAIGRLGPADRKLLEVFSQVTLEVASYLRVAVNVPDDRDEILDESLAMAFELVHPDPSVASVRAAAFGAARLLSNEWRRRQRHTAGSSLLNSACSIENDAKRSYRERLWEYEEQLLRQLPRGQRVALESHVMDDLSDRELADLSGYSRGSLAEMRRKAKIFCRNAVACGDHPPPPDQDS